VLLNTATLIGPLSDEATGDQSQSPLMLVTENFTLSILPDGTLGELKIVEDETSIMATAYSSPLLRTKRFGSEYQLPIAAAGHAIPGAAGVFEVSLTYPDDLQATIRVVQKPQYVTFELTGLSDTESVSEVSWGPYNTLLAERIGCCVGVAQENGMAFGIQTLNVKTLGGTNDLMRRRLVDTAVRVSPKHSCLQAYTSNRTKPRIIDTWSYRRIKSLEIPDETVLNSKIALFLSPSNRALDVIENIELQEGLPHPVVDGVWIKRSPAATSLKFITNFTERNIEDCIALAQEAGAACIYHPQIFESWGTFQPRVDHFPNGLEGVRTCVEKAEAAGITLGAHTLTNFIQPHDPYVTPIPDSRLARHEPCQLSTNISADVTTIPLPKNSDATIYEDNDSGALRVIRLGDELIQYSSVTDVAPKELLQCQRGAFGTTAIAHQKGTELARLVSHSYKVFFPDIHMLEEVAVNLATFFNESGLKQTSLDGFEGTLAAGHGVYGCELFANTFYQNLKQKCIVNNSSDLTHYYWHIASNESWGEPWTGDFRESHLEHRLESVRLMKDNLMPAKMGQYRIGPTTQLADINWLMGLCVGLDSGVDFYIEPLMAKLNPSLPAILQNIRSWESVRTANSLSDEQKLLLQQSKGEFELTFARSGKPVLRLLRYWKAEGHVDDDGQQICTLDPTLWGNGSHTDACEVSNDMWHRHQSREPGQPTTSIWKINNKYEDQPFQFVLRVPVDCLSKISAPMIAIGSQVVVIPVTLSAGHYLVATNPDRGIRHFDKDNRLIETVQIEFPTALHGDLELEIDYQTTESREEHSVILNYRLMQ
jgi:hypothetical protein